MGFSLSGAMAAAGGAVAEAGLDQLRANIVAERDARLQAFQAAESAKGREHATMEAEKSRQLTREEGAAGRSTTVSEGEKSRTHARGLQQDGFKHAEALAELNKKFQVELAKVHEGAAGARHAETIKLQKAQLDAQNEQVSFVPQTDGTVLKVRKDGTSVGYLTDPVTQERLKGMRTLTDATKILMDGNVKIIAALETQAAKAETMPQEKEAIQRRIAELVSENKTLAGMAGQDVPKAFPAPTSAHLEALQKRKNDPAAVAAFRKQFGDEAADRALGAPKAEPTKPDPTKAEKPAGIIEQKMQTAGDPASRQAQMDASRSTQMAAYNQKRVDEMKAEIADIEARLESGRTAVSGRENRVGLELRKRKLEEELKELEK